MLRDGYPVGAITVGREAARPFQDEQIELLKTFADQAVIAIENLRLFTELQEKNRALSEALEQQTATSEILRVISSSPTDVQPVFDTIVVSATRLCSGLFSAVYRYDGELIHLVAHHNFSPTALAAARRTFPMPPSQGGATARAVLTREVVHIPDLRLDPEYAHQVLARDVGFPSILAVPMLREGMPIGAITVVMVCRISATGLNDHTSQNGRPM
jgi:two-component system NtrC family sensor kinase